jgi:hypothetical protein
MVNENLLPDELAKAARNLEERFQMLRVPARNIALKEWSSLPTGIRCHIPPWIKALLSQFKLAQGVLENRDFRNSYARLFSFCKPDEYVHELKETELGCLGILPQFGFVPIAYESDGSMWVTKISDGPSGSIYLLDHSGWDGGEPTKENGLIFASSRLSLLLATMAVSEASYQEVPGSITSVLWIKEQ